MAGERAMGKATNADDGREAYAEPAYPHHLHACSPPSVCFRPHVSQPPPPPAPHRRERVASATQHVLGHHGGREGSGARRAGICQQSQECADGNGRRKVWGIATVGRGFFLVHITLATLGTVAGFAHAAHVPHAALGSPSKLRPLPRDGGVCKNAALFRGSGGKPSLRTRKREEGVSLESRASSNDRSASWEEDEVEEDGAGLDAIVNTFPRKEGDESNSTSVAGSKRGGKDHQTWEAKLSSASQVSSEEQDPPRFSMECGYSSIPHPLKAHKGGEDAHIICRAGGSTLVGVFDGVGAWAEVGVDPAEYPRRLGEIIGQQLRQDPDCELKSEKPLVDFLQKAVDELGERNIPGSCTACIAMLTRAGNLHVLNIGDSGLHLIRDGVSIFSTNEQQHYFNCPFQLGTGNYDTPDDADYYILEDLAEGDLIVVASDGVWDNLFQDDMIDLITAAENKSTNSLCLSISQASHLNAKDTTCVCPFSENARRQGLDFIGGKLDDITVVMARVVDQGKKPLPSPVSADMDFSSEDRQL